MSATDAQTMLKRSRLPLMWLSLDGLGSILARPMQLRNVNGSTENRTAESKELNGKSNLQNLAMILCSVLHFFSDLCYNLLAEIFAHDL